MLTVKMRCLTSRGSRGFQIRGPATTAMQLTAPRTRWTPRPLPNALVRPLNETKGHHEKI
jgi:hypothetical protein